MTAVDFILDGLEAALELERELGVRSLEVDRGLLVAKGKVEEKVEGKGHRQGEGQGQGQGQGERSTKEVKQAKQELVFLHHRPLPPKGVEMMSKIILALGRTVENSPIIVAPPVPKARVTVMLGYRALQQYFPRLKGEPGDWLKTEDGGDLLVTYSPEYFLRFSTITPVIEQQKKCMWISLKAVKQRLQS